MRTRACLIATALFLLPALAPPPALAGERAAALVEEAIQLSREGDVDAAIAKFRQAAAAEPEDALIRFQLASALAGSGRIEEAGPVFAEVVARDPQNGAARRGEVTALLFAGRYGDARIKLEEGLTALPRDGQLAHTLARLCATAPLDKVRHGELALQLALTVYDIKKSYETGETVAMAYAETGQFDKAVEVQRGLIAQAEKAGDEARLEGLRKHLLSYQRDEPWRAETPAEIAMATEPPKMGG